LPIQNFGDPARSPVLPRRRNTSDHDGSQTGCVYADHLADRLLSRREVEERFGISKRYLEVAIMRHEGPPIVRIGRSVRYRVRDVVEWIERNRFAPEESA
jgi:predicted DNA-binding transcriptional regulator AlpA